MEICFEGVGQVAATFQVDAQDDGNVQAGMAVTLTGNGTMGLGDGDKAVCGVLLGSVRGGAAAVQIGGVVKVGYSDKGVPTVGWNTLTCDAEGKVAVAEDNGASCLVLAVDTAEKTAVIKL